MTSYGKLVSLFSLKTGNFTRLSCTCPQQRGHLIDSYKIHVNISQVINIVVTVTVRGTLTRNLYSTITNG